MSIEEIVKKYHTDLDDADRAMIDRRVEEKGIEEYLGAAQYIRNKYPQSRFHICGFCDQDYSSMIDDLVRKMYANYLKWDENRKRKDAIKQSLLRGK